MWRFGYCEASSIGSVSPQLSKSKERATFILWTGYGSESLGNAFLFHRRWKSDSPTCDGSALSAQRSHTHGAPGEHTRERIVLSGSFIHTHPRKQITIHSRPGISCPFGRCIRTIHVIDVVCMIPRSFHAFVGNGGRLPDRRHSVGSETSEGEKRSHAPQGAPSSRKDACAEGSHANDATTFT
jgi:hypothetical protein